MFKSLVSGPVNVTLKAGGYTRRPHSSPARTAFKDSGGDICIRITSVSKGKRGNGYVFNLTRMLASGARYKVKLWSPVEGALETITVNGDAGSTLANVVANINENATMKKYVKASFYKDSTGLFNSNIAFANGQRLRGGK